MPLISLPQSEIHYESYGPADGFPVLLLAPGGLRSRIGLWRHTHDGLPRPWPDPTVELAHDFRVVAVDQRNAGLSSAPVGPDDGWDSFAADHLGVLDALGIDRFHVMGGCIGASFALKLAELAPGRVASAILQAPIGFTAENAALRDETFEAWAAPLRRRRPDIAEAHLQALKRNLFGGEDFVFSVQRDFVRRTTTPLLILAGNDIHHPLSISEELARLAPHAEYVRHWKGDERRASTIATVRAFLLRASASSLLRAA